MVLAAKHMEMYSFGAVRYPLARKSVCPAGQPPYRVLMHHLTLGRPLTMPSGPKAALDYASMLQLAARRGFDFHEYSDWVTAAQLQSPPEAMR